MGQKSQQIEGSLHGHESKHRLEGSVEERTGEYSQRNARNLNLVTVHPVVGAAVGSGRLAQFTNFRGSLRDM